MNSANKTLINILLGLVIAVVIGISANKASGAAGDAAAMIDMTPPISGSGSSIDASRSD